jgi:hypothetical protein
MLQGTNWSRSRQLALVLRSAVLVSLPLVLVLSPDKVLMDAPTICLFRNITGMECYGCGMTRGIHAILHGHFAAAIEFNKAVVVVAPILAVTWMRAMYDTWCVFLREGSIGRTDRSFS